MEKYFYIKEVSELTGLSASNIRYYEKRGLIKKVERNSIGIRIFDKREIKWILLLKKLRDMNMSITEIKKYAELREEGDSTIRKRMDVLEKHRENIRERIRNLNLGIKVLDEKLLVYKKMEEEYNGK